MSYFWTCRLGRSTWLHSISMLFEIRILDITDYCFFNNIAFWQSKLLRLSNEHLTVSSINHCLTDSPSNSRKQQSKHISLTPKMSNRPFSFTCDSKVQSEEPVVMGLFSKSRSTQLLRAISVPSRPSTPECLGRNRRDPLEHCFGRLRAVRHRNQDPASPQGNPQDRLP
jgi:hypothetical protein